MVHTRVFDSWNDYLDLANGLKVKGHHRGRDLGKQYWFGTNTFAQAMQLARFGWPEGTERINRVAVKVADRLMEQMESTRFNYDTTGIMFDVSRVVEGEPECWINPEPHPVKTPGKIIKIGCDCFASCGVNASVIEARGTAIAAMVYALEHAGIRVELDLVLRMTSSSYRDSSELQGIVTLKRADQDLDVDRLSFALIHPASFRRIGFCILDEIDIPYADKKAIGGLGGCYGFGQDGALPGYDLWFGSTVYGFNYSTSEEKIVEWVREQLEKQGVEMVTGG